MHIEIPRPRDATELIKFVDVHYQTEPNLSIFPKEIKINDDFSFCSRILLAIDLRCHDFPLEKLLLNVRYNVRYDVIISSDR